MQVHFVLIFLSYFLILSPTTCSGKLHFEQSKYEGHYYNGRRIIQLEDVKLFEASENVTVRFRPSITQFKPVIVDNTASVKIIKFQSDNEHADDFTQSPKILDLEAYENDHKANRITATIINVHVHFKHVDNSVISFDKLYYNGTFNNTDFNLKQNEKITFHVAESMKGEKLYVNIEEYTGRLYFKPELTPDNNIILKYDRGTTPINDIQEIIVFTLSVQVENTIAYAKFVMGVIYEDLEEYDMEFVKHDRIMELYLDELPWKFKFTAISKIPDDVVRYGFYSRIKPPPFASINKTTGEFIVDIGPSTDVFLVEVFADSDKLNLILLSRLAIVVKAREEEVLQEKAPYSFVVRHVLEDQDDEDPKKYQRLLPRPTFPGQEKEYAYCLVSTYPETVLEGDRFAIVDGAVYSKKLLRETDYFQDMKIPHFTVTVKMIEFSSLDPNGWCKDAIKTIDSENDDWVIPRSDLLTTISVIVDDANNNAPHIEEHRRTVCYPKKDLLPYIQPPYLTRVHATDKDSIESGYGIVRYGTIMGDDYYLQVDSETGIVYPNEAIYKRVGTNVVRAFDSDYNYDEIYITHRIIGAEHIAVLNLTDVQIENVESYLKTISTVDFIVRPLDIGKFYVLLPKANPSTKSYTRTLQVVVYCLKTVKTGNDEEQIEMTLLEMEPHFKKLKIAMKPFEIKTQSTNSISRITMSNNKNALFTAVAVLGVVICLGFWM